MRHVSSSPSLHSYFAQADDSSSLRMGSSINLGVPNINTNTIRNSYSGNANLSQPLGSANLVNGFSSPSAFRSVSRFFRNKYVKLVLVFLFVFGLLLVHNLVVSGPNVKMGSKITKSGPSGKNYGLLIDAGSSGSRLYIYSWADHDGDADDLLEIHSALDARGLPLSMKTSPGISHYSNEPYRSFESIKELLEYASRHIPLEKQPFTSLYILATAGMRLLTHSQQKAIQMAIVKGVAKNYNFIFRPEHMEIISGKMEGIYAWITLNYLTKRFKHEGDKRDVTSGVIDMGGASTQIAFEIPWQYEIDEDSEYAENIVEIDLGCGLESVHDHDGIKVPIHKYRVFSVTYLGYGANEAKRRYYESILKKPNLWKTDGTKFVGEDPCTPPGMVQNFMEDKYKLVGNGNYDKCKDSLIETLNVTASCQIDPYCSFNNVQRPIPNINEIKFWGLAEYWYTSRDVFHLVDHGYNQTLFDSKASEYCKTDWSVIEKKFKNGDYPNSSFDRLRSQCFKASWMSDSLHLGHGFTEKGDFNPVSVLEGVDVQWTLGAMIYKTRFQPIKYLQKEKVKKTLGQSKVENYTGELTNSMIIVFVIVFLAFLFGIRFIWKYYHMTPQTPLYSNINIENTV